MRWRARIPRCRRAKSSSQQWQQTIPLLSTPATANQPPGTNAPEDWSGTIQTLTDAGLLETAKDPSEYWDSKFTPKAEQ